MRNLIAFICTAVVGFTTLFSPSTKDLPQREIDTTLASEYVASPNFESIMDMKHVHGCTEYEKQKADAEVDQWILHPGETLVAAQSGYIDDEPDSEKIIEEAAKQAADSVTSNVMAAVDEKFKAANTSFTSTSTELESRLTLLENLVDKIQSDVTDLSNGQADLTKRVEELTVKVETITKEGKVSTKTVAVNESGDGEFNLAPGEILKSVDGVPVKSSTFSGGSYGSQVSSTTTTYQSSQYGSMPTSSGYGSNGGGGNVSYAAAPPAYSQTNYSTVNYSATAVPTSTGQQVSLRRTTPLRSRQRPFQNLLNRQPSFGTSSPGVCVGPGCSQ